MPEIKRPAHRDVIEILSRLNRGFLSDNRCYFGGGTRIVLELGEYRESRDIDFLCSDRDGYRNLREQVSERSLGPLSAKGLALAREVRTDQYGIRTFVQAGEARMKFEIVREGRVDLEESVDVPRVPVACLTHKHCFAEKFLANTDRGLDGATLSRDIVDLAFMTRGWARADLNAGLAIAQAAYGKSILASLAGVLQKMRERAYRARCIEGLAIEDSKTLAAGLKELSTLG